jgi:hypothetical protein
MAEQPRSWRILFQGWSGSSEVDSFFRAEPAP